MMDQTIWLSPRAYDSDDFEDIGAADHGYLGAQVEGRLALDREHTDVTCVRGHWIRIERANHHPIGVLSA